MNSEERDMIAGLFDRLNAAGVPDKDRDAERLIAQYVKQMPDSPYMLVQTVLIQEHALQQAEARIRELESQLAGPQQRGSTGSGSFLGGLKDSGRTTASVPSAGGRAMSSDQGGYAPSPWQSGPAQGMPQMPRAPEMPPMPQQPAPSSGGGFGGFMRGAMTTAAGVAGGMMIGDALRGMMGGGSHNPLGGSGGSHGHQTGSPLGGPGEKPHYQDASNNDPGGGYLASDHAQDVAQDAEIEEGWDDDGGDDDSVEA